MTDITELISDIDDLTKATANKLNDYDNHSDYVDTTT